MRITTPPPRHRLRAALCCTVGAAMATALLGRLASVTWPPSIAVARPEDVVAGVLAWAGAALAGWLTVGTLLAAVSLLPGAVGTLAARIAVAVTPRAVRGVLAMALGAYTGSMALPAGAAGWGPALPGAGATASRSATVAACTGPATTRPTPGATSPAPDPAFHPTLEHRGPATSPTGPPCPSPPGSPPRDTAPAPAESASPGWRPTAPPARPGPGGSRLLAPPPRITAASSDVVTVRRGDSLWSIAARHLGPVASDAEVARAWPQWYTANRDVLGPDPDALFPGQQLRPPCHGARP